MKRLQLNSEGFGSDELLNRFEIVIFTPIINRWFTDNEDSALTKIKSMVGNISFEFIDYELDYSKTINDLKDYQELIKKYRR